MEQNKINAYIYAIVDKNNSGCSESCQFKQLHRFLNRNTPTSGSLIFLLSRSTIKLSTFPVFKGNNLNPYDVAFEM